MVKERGFPRTSYGDRYNGPINFYATADQHVGPLGDTHTGDADSCTYLDCFLYAYYGAGNPDPHGDGEPIPDQYAAA